MLQIILFSVISLTSAEEPPRDPSPSTLSETPPCAQQLYQMLEEWEAPTGWSKHPSTLPGHVILTSPTVVTGVWLEMLFDSEHTTLRRVSPSDTTTVTWAPKNDCVTQMSVKSLKPKPHAASNGFTDDELDRILKKSGKNKSAGLIYVWSPHMYLSIRGLEEARALGKKLKIPVTVLLDPRANTNTAKKELRRNHVKEEHTRRLASIELDRRMQSSHYPTYFFYRNGKIIQVRPGYEEIPRLEALLRKGLLE